MGNFLESVSRSCNTMGFKIKDNAPTLATVIGIGGLIFASIKACQKTLELPEIIDTHKKAMQEITDNLNDDGKTIETKEGTIKASEAAFRVQSHLCWSIVKLYWFPVTVGALSITAIGWGQYETNKRYSKALAAYVGISETFRGYRERVAKRFGDDIEKEIRYNIQKEEIEEEVTDDKGKVKKKKTKVDVVNPEDMMDDFTAYFTSWTAPEEWNPSMLYNRNHIIEVERWANQRFKTRKRYFINDILDDLGIKARPSGQFVGWCFDESADHIGDNEIRIEITESKFRHPKTGHIEPGFILEFNADGNIIKNAFKD